MDVARSCVLDFRKHINKDLEMKISKKLQYMGIGLIVLGVTNALVLYLQLSSMKGDSRIVNYCGIVRGATQRLVKLETNGKPSDKLIAKLDGITKGLVGGSEKLELTYVTDEDFQQNIQAVKAAWGNLKKTILDARVDHGLYDNLIEESEKYFELTNKAVFSAEAYGSSNITDTILLQLLFLFISLGVLSLVMLISKRDIAEPLAELVESSLQIAEGDLGVRIAYKKDDEIGDLANSLNVMLDNIAGPIKELSEVAEVIAGGDLTTTVQVTAKGDIVMLIQSFTVMTETLYDLITNIKQNASTTAASSEELSASAEEVNASLQEISATTNIIANGAQTVSQETLQAQEASPQNSYKCRGGQPGGG